MSGERPGLTPEELLVHPDDYKDPESGLDKESAALLAGAYKDKDLAHIKFEEEYEVANGEVAAMDSQNAEITSNDHAVSPEIEKRVREQFPNATEETKKALAHRAYYATKYERMDLLNAKRKAEVEDEKAAQELLKQLSEKQ